MTLLAIGRYEPTWQAGGHRIPGSDEDVVTLAVAAGLATIAAGGSVPVDRVVLVTAHPDELEGFAGGVLALGLGLAEDVPVERRLGGAPATVAALHDAGPGCLVIGVDPDAPAGAAGALFGPEGGAILRAAGRVGRSLPIRVRRVDQPSLHRYDDRRLERDRGWLPALERLATDDAVVVGIPAKDAVRLGGPGSGVAPVGAAAPLFALADLADAARDARLVALDAGEAAALDVEGVERVVVKTDAREALPWEDGPHRADDGVVIPISLPAYDRARTSKLGMVAARCTCGALSFPPRLRCLACGSEEGGQAAPLPRDGSVYSAVTVHVPVPGIAGPYGLAIIEFEGIDVRVLAHVTDQPGGGVAIDTPGRLVFRRVAVREGVPDYGYGFQPAREDQEAVR